MSKYAVQDLHHSLRGGMSSDIPISREDVVYVVAAWGEKGTGNQWSGGFLLELSDDPWYAYLSGWCDHTGWGCQSGADLEFYDERPKLYWLERDSKDWDPEPIDLNRYVKGEIDQHGIEQ